MYTSIIHYIDSTKPRATVVQNVIAAATAAAQGVEIDDGGAAIETAGVTPLARDLPTAWARCKTVMSQLTGPIVQHKVGGWVTNTDGCVSLKDFPEIERPNAMTRSVLMMLSMMMMLSLMVRMMRL